MTSANSLNLNSRIRLYAANLVKIDSFKLISLVILTILASLLFFEKNGINFYHLTLQNNNISGNSRVINLVIPPRGSTTRNVLDFEYTGEISVQHNLDDENSQSLLKKYCNVDDNTKINQCHIPLMQTNDNIQFTLTPLAGATISDLTVRTLSINHQYNFGKNKVYFLIAILLISLPILWITHPYYVLNQWLLISFAVVILLSLQPIYTLILLVFLSIMFKLGKKLSKKSAHSFHLFLLLFAIILVSLICAKYGAELIGLIFSNSYPSMVLPLGISYFVIRLVDTLLRWYRGELTEVTYREFMCFIIFPPTIFAGPIETLNNFINNRFIKITKDDIAYGLARIAIGLFKKLVVANFILAPIIYGQPHNLFFKIGRDPATASFSEISTLLTASLFFSYFDFSGYSDIAIGLSRLYGYKIMENFTWPILARNLQEFWRRWHRSLSMWCFRNVYFPTAVSTRSPYLPILVTMLVVGLWHSYGLTWFSWAIYHGIALMFLTYLEKFKLDKRFEFIKYFAPLSILITLGYVALGHAFVLYNDYWTATHVFFQFWKRLLAVILKWV